MSAYVRFHPYLPNEVVSMRPYDVPFPSMDIECFEFQYSYLIILPGKLLALKKDGDPQGSRSGEPMWCMPHHAASEFYIVDYNTVITHDHKHIVVIHQNTGLETKIYPLKYPVEWNFDKTEIGDDVYFFFRRMVPLDSECEYIDVYSKDYNYVQSICIKHGDKHRDYFRVLDNDMHEGIKPGHIGFLFTVESDYDEDDVIHNASMWCEFKEGKFVEVNSF